MKPRETLLPEAPTVEVTYLPPKCSAMLLPKYEPKKETKR